MSFARGERVYFDPDPNQDFGAHPSSEEHPAPSLTTAFVGEIVERSSSTANPPSVPAPKSTTKGFPALKKRTPKVSAFKQQRAGHVAASEKPALADAPPRTAPGAGSVAGEKQGIDEENKERLSRMSAEEIQQERQELLSALSPSLIQRLLGRSNIDDGSNEQDLGLESPAPPTNPAKMEEVSSSKRKVTFNVPQDPQEPAHSLEKGPSNSAVQDTVSVDIDEPPGSAQSSAAVHFPEPPPVADLDPNSDTFLTDLHEKYFPNLSYDPASVSWMKPIDPTDTKSPYHPSQTALEPAELRFNFKGALLAPSAAREIPVTDGLHHHAEAPEAAGYTIPELARLSRSAVPTQRCIAYQTLGRILHRLGKGEFGVEEPKMRVEGPVGIAKDPAYADPDDDWEEESVGSAMARGLWDCMDEGRVIETLTKEANEEKGHLTAKTYAREALWSWRSGGGRKKPAV
ncbi:hypothetical protein EJ04DRAFT_487047 [Polyplosphaeria fusca]|uniref:Uncharacterized protein n=1 Tax=Polyplosphaeria fusca TaxID=682080 RepID=A0A9P4R6Y6_9PLEO|nr:hypothetical protein EJ04DRAFT_487047 [Polyplosphaeria fusca]